MLSFTENRDQPRNRQVCLTTPSGEQRFKITDRVRGFSAADLLHRQKHFKPLPMQVALCQAMAVRLQLYQIPLFHYTTYQIKRSLLNEGNRIETHGKPVNGDAGIPYPCQNRR